MKATEHEKVFVIIGYIFPLIGLIWYVLDKEVQRPFGRYHLVQFLTAWLAGIVWGVGYTIVYLLVGLLTLGLFLLVGWVGYFLPLAWLIQGVIHGARGEQKPLWLIGPLVEKLNL